MTVIRAAEGRRTPWKNGGGDTTEIAVHPPGAGFDGFDWRVSTARVAADGPFSAFPGVDRTLAVLTGEGLELAVGTAAPVRLTAASAPFAFQADAPCTGRLLGGPVTDFNVMARRERFTQVVRHLDVAGSTTLDTAGGVAVVFCHRGTIAAAGAVLRPGDSLVSAAPVEVASRSGTALVAVIRPV